MPIFITKQVVVTQRETYIQAEDGEDAQRRVWTLEDCQWDQAPSKENKPAYIFTLEEKPHVARMVDPEQPHIQVAYDLGFSNAGHFPYLHSYETEWAYIPYRLVHGLTLRDAFLRLIHVDPTHIAFYNNIDAYTANGEMIGSFTKIAPNWEHLIETVLTASIYR